ncbi:MAG: molybdopterin-dependent oxidoreductase [Fuerstiella sp.]|nr:molybdopterin-dependent oxidoreductase [Fuerstiella sp.]MCP4858723.1 molybdopterin-dependent oxidoreductase [Fuerstiella sp.]
MNNSFKSLLYSTDGPLTRELLREPGNFGLGQVPAKAKPDGTTDMVCGYCSTGCSLRIHLKDGAATSLTPTTDYPVNLGMACPKGWEALTVLDSPDRATTPLLRDESGRSVPVGWDCAMQTFAKRFKAIQQEHGPHSVAFLGTGQIATEEMAFLGALAKFGMGLLHGDGNTRQCMATSAVAYKQAFGFDAPPYTYSDFEESDVIVLIGSNLCIAHPIMWERVMRNPHSPEIIVVDPRMTETAMNATQHVALSPKSDLTLLYGIARILIENGSVDTDYVADHTNGFAEFSEYLMPFSDERVIAETGLSRDQIHRFAETIHRGKRVSFWWTMGVNQSHQGVRTAQAIINLALITGNMGRPGTGANSITGQCNAMGSRLFSNTTNLLGGHDFTNVQHRQKIAGILNIDPDLIPRENSLLYHEIMEGILSGRIRGLWVICTNPAHSWINQNQCRDILERLDFLVVQDMYANTETAQMADLVLPAAGWGEKEGTLINSERRVSRIKKVAPAPGQAMSDFSIFKLVAHYWGCEKLFKDWNSPQDVFQILKRCSAGQPCDLTGIDDYEFLDSHGGVQWPAPEPASRGRQSSDAPQMKHQGTDISRSLFSSERRLFEDGRYYHADGRAKFLFEDPRPLTERPNEKFPFILLTGRGTASQWHTQTRTKQSAVLRKLYPADIFVEINPADARRLLIGPNDKAIVESQRGRVLAKAVLTHAVQPGQVFIPMHYRTTNQLTDAVFDPYSGQPGYKACAVRVFRG